MRAKREVTFYNILFPIWFLILFPVAWVVVLPANFIIDSIVLLISIKLIKLKGIKEIYLHSILRVWVVGFLSDFIGAGILFLGSEGNGSWSEYLNAVSWNPFDNLYAVLFVAFAVIVSGICIYIGNLKFSMSYVVAELRNKRLIALALAIFTAPYILFYPSSLMHGNSWDELKFMTNHIVKQDEVRLEVLLNEAPSNPSDEERIIMSYYQHDMKDAVNIAEKTSNPVLTNEKQPEFTFLFYSRDYSDRKEIPVWLIGEKGYFSFREDWYELDREKMAPFLEAVADVRNTRGKLEFVITPDPQDFGSINEAAGLKEDKDGKKESDYPIYQDSENRYFSPKGHALFDSAVILFKGREPVDIYTALDKGLVTPQELILHGIDLRIEARE